MTFASVTRLCLLSTVAVFITLPDAARADSFTDALKAAYEANPRIQAKRKELASLDEEVSQAFSGWRPTIEGSVIRGRKRTDFANTGWNHTDDNSKQLVIDQPLFNGGETVAATHAAESLVEAGKAELHQTEQQVLLDTVTSYMDVLQSQAVYQLSKNNEEVLRQQWQATKDRFDVGEVTKTDVSQSEARLSRAQAEVSQAEGDYNSARANFRRLTNTEAKETMVIPTLSIPLPKSMKEAEESASGGNPLILQATKREEAAQHNVNKAMASLLPDLSLRGTISRQDNAGTFGASKFDTDSVTLNLTVPLYQSGSEYSTIRQNKETALQRKYETINATDQVREGADRAWNQYVATRDAIESREKAILAAETALEGVKQEQQYGARTTLDVLDQEQELFQARVELVRARRDHIVSQYTLLGAIGRLTAKDIGLDSPIYDANEHYNNVKYKMIGF